MMSGPQIEMLDPEPSSRCLKGQHVRCNGLPCPCDCGHPGALNARMAKGVALHDREGHADKREILAMLGLIDWPFGREILPDDTRPNDIADLANGPMGRSGDERQGYAPDEPMPPNCTTPPGLRVLPPKEDEVA